MYWTEEKKTEIVNWFKEGKLAKEIAELTGKSPKAIRVLLNKLGYKYTQNADVTNTCLTCNEEFVSRKGDKRKFCSKSCSATFTNVTSPKKKKKPIHSDDVHNHVIELNMNPGRTCAHCGKATTTSKNAYCSHSCSAASRKTRNFDKVEQGISLSSRTCKNYLIYKHGNKCMECGWGEVHSVTGKVPVELEHMDGNSDNNSLDNLKLLCPNCHSLTPTYKALNIGNGRHNRKLRYQEGKSF